ncbi:peptidyl-tRNA hydrolase protein 1 [Lobosporangium transversale]|uniref:Peptidyl-tRNA hydrolase n=1 Tax=Lobosporangium transversale TaxID=64571 RepID=A0A1Y2GAJ1_9FUNG|nr:peptidyl-tRNA hydrolase-domain-containing protein [Lobosporangium transversale]KAF9919364.1 peptidyl-tRNA hydrolase protein 1 [Lobosporangium transversale]ORZ05540.1 peptidyl-tRNA hydrolase-domain-containing protein [Lobosporangium transversale]|eukprot:XP_021877114.1 peptidyl-tRNA hydrolase-domain-containing protein [Lobosporangium transversale]
MTTPMATTYRHILVVGLGNHTHPGTRHNVGMMVIDSIAKRFNAEWTRMNQWQAEIATFETSVTFKKKTPNLNRVRVSPQGVKKLLAAEGTLAEAEETATAAEGTMTAAIDPSISERKKRPLAVLTKFDLKVTLLKPLQAMNICGSSVYRAARDLKLPVKDIIVVHDDMERDIGKLSFKSEGSANGHNGIKSCVKSLKTQHFRRLRVGIGRPESKQRDSEFIASYVLGKFRPFEVEQLEKLVYEKAGDEIIRIFTADPTPHPHVDPKPIR